VYIVIDPKIQSTAKTILELDFLWNLLGYLVFFQSPKRSIIFFYVWWRWRNDILDTYSKTKTNSKLSCICFEN